MEKKKKKVKLKQILFYVNKEHYNIAMQTIKELIKKYK
jgi:hypothetical protein